MIKWENRNPQNVFYQILHLGDIMDLGDTVLISYADKVMKTSLLLVIHACTYTFKISHHTRYPVYTVLHRLLSTIGNFKTIHFNILTLIIVLYR